MSQHKILNLGAIVLDPKLQSRVEINEDKVAEYAESMERGAVFPALTVHFDGINYYLSNGFHRYMSVKRLGKASVNCEVINGTFRDAVLYSTGVNSTHGLPRTIADKRKAVITLLEDFEWGQWSNAEIARQCDVSAPFVKKIRDERAIPQDKVKYKTASGDVTERKSTSDREDKPKKEKQETPPPDDTPEIKKKLEASEVLIGMLQQENQQVKDKLALGFLKGSEEDKNLAKQTIEELREELRITKIELEAVKRSRDTFQNENNQMRKQITMLQKKLKAANLD